MNELKLNGAQVTLKQTKSGKTALIADNMEQAVGMIAGQFFGKFLAEIASEIKSLREQNDELREFVKSTLEKSAEGGGFKRNSFDSFPPITLRNHITALLKAIARAKGKKRWSSKDLNEIYDRLVVETGFDPRLKDKEYFNESPEDFAESFVNTCFNHGYGAYVAQAAEDYLNMLKASYCR